MRSQSSAALIFAITVLGMTALSPSAAAQTFCSARTADGVWAMTFGPQPMAHHCEVVRRHLRSASATEITDINSGYYHPFGVNRVLISCGFYYRNVIASTGEYALQNAVNTAGSSGLSHCIFAVNGF